MNQRPALSGPGLSTGKQARLYRTLHSHGLGNGTVMFLPYDQGLEHGPQDFLANPAAADPAYIRRLVDVVGQMPLIVRLNGGTELPPADAPFSPLNASVRGAVRLGANVVGTVREDAESHGMPIIVWAYLRGSAMQTTGGQDSFHAIDYAARTAVEVGADTGKVNVPDPTVTQVDRAPYDRQYTYGESLRFTAKITDILTRYPTATGGLV